MGRKMAKKTSKGPKRGHKKFNKSRSLLDDSGVVQKSKDVTFVDKLLDEADSLVNRFEYEAAQKFCQRALDQDPNHIRALETSASLMIEVEETDAAIQCLQQAVKLSPDSGYNKYLVLGQLFEGLEAILQYKKGIEIMEKALNNSQNEASNTDRSELKRTLSSAYCSVSEIYMSDCCFEENAETESKSNIEKAIETDNSNPEAYLCLGNLFMVQENKEEAIKSIQKSLSLWLPRFQDIREGKIEVNDFDPVEVCPLSYDSRINTSKLLIELELYDDCVEILEGLLDENDEIVEVWHLLGWANYLHGEDYKENAKFYLNKALKVAKKVQFDDEELIKHIEDLVEELGPEVEEEQNGDNDENNWEDISDEEEEMQT